MSPNREAMYWKWVLEWGISAFFINKHSPRSPIIEANHEVAEQAREFARQNPNVKVIEGFWQDVIEQIANESYDGVLFDTYPIDGVHEDEDALRSCKEDLTSAGRSDFLCVV